MNRLDIYFKFIVRVPRIKFGKRQSIETLINEEVSLLAKYLRNEKTAWNPRLIFDLDFIDGS